MQTIEVEESATFVIRKANGETEKLDVLPGNKIHLSDEAVIMAVIPNTAGNMILEQ